MPSSVSLSVHYHAEMKHHHQKKKTKEKRCFPSVNRAVLGCMIALMVVLSATNYMAHKHIHRSSLTEETLPSSSMTDHPEQKISAPAAPVQAKVTAIAQAISPQTPPEVALKTPKDSQSQMKPHHLNSSHSKWGDTSLKATLNTLKAHPLFNIMSKNPNSKIENVLIEMQAFEKCIGQPIIITMAKIGTPLYWQLVQNFVYSMAKFDVVECSLMVCISDAHCMKLCQQSSFPCYQYDDHSGEISAFQKIANLKLHAVPLAAAKGVSG